MKKILIATLILAMVLPFAAGCGGGSGGQGEPLDLVAVGSGSQGGGDASNSPSAPGGATQGASPGSSPVDIDFAGMRAQIMSNTGANMAWPSADLPIGFPVYPGEVDLIDFSLAGYVILGIGDTDEATFNAYKAALISAGWTFDEPDDIYLSAHNNTQQLIMIYDDGILVIGVETESSVFYSWPAELLFEIPVYTDGEFSFGAFASSQSTMITIVNTSPEAYNSYIDLLIELGFELATERGPNINGLWHSEGEGIVTLNLSDDGTEVSISLQKL